MRAAQSGLQLGLIAARRGCRAVPIGMHMGAGGRPSSSSRAASIDGHGAPRHSGRVSGEHAQSGRDSNDLVREGSGAGAQRRSGEEARRGGLVATGPLGGPAGPISGRELGLPGEEGEAVVPPIALQEDEPVRFHGASQVSACCAWSVDLARRSPLAPQRQAHSAGGAQMRCVKSVLRSA